MFEKITNDIYFISTEENPKLCKIDGRGKITEVMQIIPKDNNQESPPDSKPA